ncbi:PA-phosphatase related-family protein [Acrasis kona]|uniref:PA-phosphatase related-family protein n=1 Tax=Acrasis kona TaxID=1008807 RepID=A0AAW2ZAK7_9EUKA
MPKPKKQDGKLKDKLSQIKQTRMAQVFGRKRDEDDYFEIPRSITNDMKERITAPKFNKAMDMPSSFSMGRNLPVGLYAAEWATVLLFICYFVLFSLLRYPERAFRLDDPNLSYPLLPPGAPWWGCLLLNIVAPLVVCLGYNILFVRNKNDIHHLVLGFAICITSCLYFTSFLWLIVGGLPPNFIDQCQPDFDRVLLITNQRANSFSQVVYFYPSEICTQGIQTISTSDNVMITGGYIQNLIPSFPSGRASTGFAGWIYAALYVNAKLDTWRLSMGHYWKLLVVIIPVQIATYVSLTGLIDFHHSWDQVFAGVIVGILCGALGYTSKYVNIRSHVPSIYLWRALGDYLQRQKEKRDPLGAEIEKMKQEEEKGPGDSDPPKIPDNSDETNEVVNELMRMSIDIKRNSKSFEESEDDINSNNNKIQ